MPAEIERKLCHEVGFGVAFGFAMKACGVVADLAVDRLDGASERLGLEEQMGRDDFAVGAPAVGGHGEGFEMRYSRPEPPEGFVSTTAHFHGKDASCGARHSNP